MATRSICLCHHGHAARAELANVRRPILGIIPGYVCTAACKVTHQPACPLVADTALEFALFVTLPATHLGLVVVVPSVCQLSPIQTDHARSHRFRASVQSNNSLAMSYQVCSPTRPYNLSPQSSSFFSLMTIGEPSPSLNPGL